MPGAAAAGDKIRPGMTLAIEQQLDSPGRSSGLTMSESKPFTFTVVNLNGFGVKAGGGSKGRRKRKGAMGELPSMMPASTGCCTFW